MNRASHSRASGGVLLLQAEVTLQERDAESFGIFPPLGLGYLAAVLEQDGLLPVVRDLQAERTPGQQVCYPDRIDEILRRHEPALVGITSNFSSFHADSLRLASTVKACRPRTLVVMGGAHASVEVESVLQSGAVDAVVVGEGEGPFRALVGRVLADDLSGARGLPGTSWRVDDRIHHNPLAEPIADLDEIPFVAHHLLPMERYIWQRDRNFQASMRWPIAHMITTRGCRFHCVFCSTSQHFKRFRARSASNVVAEMRLLIDRYRIREFHFHDDCFMGNPAGVRALCQQIIDGGLDVRWQVSQGINSSRLDLETLRLMHRSGMYRIGFPIESASHATLRYIRKPVRLDHVERLIEACNRLGIYTFACFMVGFPEETPEQVEETLAFIRRSGLDYVKISVVQPLAGSELLERARTLGLVEGELRHGSTYFNSRYDTLHFKAAELNLLRARAMREFSQRRVLRICSPAGIRRYVLPKLRSTEDLAYFLRMGLLSLRGF